MLPRADLNPTRPPASLDAPTSTVSATDARLEVFRRLSQIAIGRELQATVESMLDDGTYLVKVADAGARMALPVGTKVGDSLSMVFIAREPRPTFLLTQQQGSAPASLSATARLIDHLLQTAEQDGAPATVIARTPLTTATAITDAKHVAAALKNGLTSSGLFYESHLHDWISGSRLLAEIAHEPQAQIKQAERTPLLATRQDATNLDLARLAADLRELGDGTHKLLDLIRNTRLQSAVHQGIDADLIAPQQSTLPMIEPESARLIHLQLNALEHQQIRWQGELFPGQPMEWVISEDDADGNGQSGEQSTWTSTVRFEMPHLGGISASIRLIGERVHVQINTSSETTAESLRAYSDMLADALEAAGSPLDSFLVKRDEVA